jgi:NADH-dependent peroxiredoxin subunit F
MYDLIIIGAGPAGITAGIYAVRKRMNFLVITRDLGGQTNWTKNIENYTGFHLISGCDLVKRFKEHLSHYDVQVKEGERATLVKKEGDVVRVTTTKGTYETRTLVLTTGMVHRQLGVPGESKFIGKGIAYCATCDAPLFQDMDVAVIGGGNSALDAVLQLTKIARKVYVLDREPKFRADPIVVEKVEKDEKVSVYHSAQVEEIMGDSFVKGLRFVQDGVRKELAVEGIFVEIGWTPSSAIAPDLEKNERGEVLVNCRSETNIPGIFAAGDVTSVPAKQIIVACGEGAKAVLTAFAYVNRESPQSIPEASLMK